MVVKSAGDEMMLVVQQALRERTEAPSSVRRPLRIGLLLVLMTILPALLGLGWSLPTVLGLVVLRALVPQRQRVESPNRGYRLDSWLLDFRILPYALFPIAFSLFRILWENGGMIIWLILLFEALGCCSFLVIAGIFGLRLVRLTDRRSTKALAQYLFLSGWDETPIEFRWEDSETVVVTHHGEYDTAETTWPIQTPLGEKLGSRRSKIRDFLWAFDLSRGNIRLPG